jgi:hypothetical protein
MYANSTGTNYPVANSIVISEVVTITEGSTLILRCSNSSSTRTTWEKSQLTDFHLTTYADDNQINPSIEHANRLRVVGNFSIGIYNLQIQNVSLVDEGLYRCEYVNNNVIHTKYIRVSLKSKYYLTISNCIVLQTTYIMVFFMFTNLRWEVIVHFVDMCWPSLFKLSFHN